VTTSGLHGVALGLGLACFAAYQQFKLPVVLPVLLAEYDYDRTLAGAFMSIYALAGLLLSVWLGALIGRRGPGALLLIALALLAAGSALSLAAPESGLLVLLGRGLEGIAFAVLAISGPVIAQASAPPRMLPIVIGLTAAWIPVGQLSATLLAPIALATVGWRALWYLAIAGALAFAVWVWAATRADAVALVPRAGAAPEPPLGARERLSLILAAAVFTLWSGQYFAYMTWLPQYLVEEHRLGVAAALLGYVVPVALVLAFNILTGVALRAGVRAGWLLLGALVSQAAVWWLLPVTGGGAAGLASLIIYGVGAGIAPACLFAMPNAVLGRGHGTAAAFGILMTGRNLGVLIGPVLIAEVFKASGAWSAAGPVFGLLTSACAAIAWVLALRLAR